DSFTLLEFKLVPGILPRFLRGLLLGLPGEVQDNPTEDHDGQQSPTDRDGAPPDLWRNCLRNLDWHHGGWSERRRRRRWPRYGRRYFRLRACHTSGRSFRRT